VTSAAAAAVTPDPATDIVMPDPSAAWNVVSNPYYMEHYGTDAGVSGIVQNTVAPGAAVTVRLRNVQNEKWNGHSWSKNIGLAADNVQLLAIAPGDLDASGDVTPLEAFTTFNNIGATAADGITLANGYTYGDANADGTVSPLEAFTAFNDIGNYAAALGTAGDGVASLVYDPATGGVTLEDQGGNGINSIYLDTSAAGLTLDNSKLALSGNTYTTSTIAMVTGTSASDGDTIGEAGFLPVGLTLADFANVTFLYGDPNTTGNQTGDVMVVPEPATMSLLALGGLALIRRRRRA
jgi:hypothetical protein